MELKVWVEGIQRVVCGANYSTTCQDVVVALAHAMGRTGRFTLVEKWRDSERPLTPQECPLRSLHKWGEYAGEVRFYLVQAQQQTDKARQLDTHPKSQRSIPSGQEVDAFSHNFSPPSKPQPYPPGVAETVKRSSTFSGAHKGPYSTLPSNFSSTSHYRKAQQQNSGPIQSSSSTKPRYPPTLGVPNGDFSPPSSSNNSSPRFTSRISPRSGPSPHPSQRLEDVREIHPANMPGVRQVYPTGAPSQGNSRPNYLQQQQQYSTSSSSHHPHHPQQQHQLPQQYPQNSQDTWQAPSNRPPPPAYQHPPNHTQQSLPYSAPNYSHPQSNSRQQQQQHPIPAPRHHSQHRAPSPQDVVEYENFPTSRRPASAYIMPGLSRDHSHSPITQSSNSQRDYTRERSRERRPEVLPGEKGRPQQSQTNNRNYPGSGYNYNNNNNSQALGESWSSSEGYKSNDVSNVQSNDTEDWMKDTYRDELAKGSYAYSDKFGFDRLGGHARSRTIERGRPTAQSGGAAIRSKSAERPVAQVSQGPPPYSVRRGEPPQNYEAHMLSKSLPSAGMNMLRRSDGAGRGGRVNFVESALRRQQRSSDDGPVQIEKWADGRQYSNEDGEVRRSNEGPPGLQPSDAWGNTTQPVRTAVKSQPQTIRPSQPASNTMRHPGEAVGSSNTPTSYVSNPVHSVSSRTGPVSSSPSSPPSVLSISPSRHNSAFTEVSPRTQGLTPPSPHPLRRETPGGYSHPSPHPPRRDPQSIDRPSPRQDQPVVYDLDHPGLEITAPHPTQDLPHSRQASLEIEEYDLDLNFPDASQRDGGHMVHRDLAGHYAQRPIGPPGGANSVPVEYRMEPTAVTPRPASVRGETYQEDYQQLLEQVKSQQETISAQEAKINQANAEIGTLEDNEVLLQDDLDIQSQLQVIVNERGQLEQQEVKGQVELQELNKVEWVDVVEREVDREKDLKKQLENVKQKLSEVSSQLVQLQEEETKKKKEVESEKERLRKAKQIELAANQEVEKTKSHLKQATKSHDQLEVKLKQLETEINQAEEDLSLQESTVLNLEADLRDENFKDFVLHPVPKEPPPTSDSSHKGSQIITTAATTITVDTTTAASEAHPSRTTTATSGEAILKLLEEGLSARLSPRTPPGPDTHTDEGMAQAIHTSPGYKSPLAAQNPNGVWV